MFKEMFERLLHSKELAAVQEKLETARRRAEEAGPDVQSIVQAHVDALPDDQWELLYMHKELGMNYHEIAKVLGITEQVALKRISHVYAELRIRLDGKLH